MSMLIRKKIQVRSKLNQAWPLNITKDYHRIEKNIRKNASWKIADQLKKPLLQN